MINKYAALARPRNAVARLLRGPATQCLAWAVAAPAGVCRAAATARK